MWQSTDNKIRRNHFDARHLFLASVFYRMRWDIEKSFDEFKNKLGEQKAWASNPTAKTMQAQLLCLSFNLLHLLDHQLAQEGIVYVAEHTRRAKRLAQTQPHLKAKNALVPKALRLLHNLTQHSVKFIRWVVARLHSDHSWACACASLTTLYAHL